MSDDSLQSSNYDIPPEMQGTVSITSLDKVYAWSRKNSMWPMMFGLACCAIEMVVLAASRFDIARFGMEVMRPSPRQSDFLIVSGTVTKKMVPQIVRLYNQMPEPKYVVAMGACASGGGPFKEGYSVVSGIDKFISVDVYIPGCPPTPQALMNGLIALTKKVDKERIKTSKWYSKGAEAAVPVPVLGPDLMDPRKYALIYEQTHRPIEPEIPAETEQKEG
ncbi:MAG: NADH-quinone oxidoreductase subunit B [Bellilinea sp.]